MQVGKKDASLTDAERESSPTQTRLDESLISARSHQIL